MSTYPHTPADGDAESRSEASPAWWPSEKSAAYSRSRGLGRALQLAVVMALVLVMSLFIAAQARATDPAPTCTTETTDWVAESPGEGWTEVDSRTIEAEGFTEHEYSRQVQTDPGSPAVPPVDEVSHVECVYKLWHDEVGAVEYQWKWWGDTNHGRTVWTDGSYPTEPGWGNGDWRKNGQTRTVVVTEGYWEYSEHLAQAPGDGWIKTDDCITVVDVEGQPGIPEVPPTFETELAWGLEGTFSREWTATGETRFVETAPGYTEYRFEREVCEDPTEPPATEEPTPTDPPTTPEEPTDPPTVPEEPTTPVEPPTTPEEPTTPVEPTPPTVDTPEPPTTTTQRIPTPDTLAETGPEHVGGIALAVGLLGLGLVLVARARRAVGR